MDGQTDRFTDGWTDGLSHHDRVSVAAGHLDVELVHLQDEAPDPDGLARVSLFVSSRQCKRG